MKTLMERGVASANPATQCMTLEVQERLLSQGLFDYLDVDCRRSRPGLALGA